MLEQETKQLADWLQQKNQQTDAFLEQKKRMDVKARERAHQKIKELNLAFEEEQQHLQSQMEQEVREYENIQKEKTQKEMTHLEQQYEKSKSAAFEKFREEILTYGHR